MYEWFGGRPPVGGRPGARAPWAPREIQPCPLNICAVFYQISTDTALARSLSDSWASCYICTFIVMFQANLDYPVTHFIIGVTPAKFLCGRMSFLQLADLMLSLFTDLLLES